MGGGQIFVKTRRDASFNKDLLNEPTFEPDPSRWTVPLKVHKIENFFGFDFEICTFS
jgi:hypothetical protein